MTHLDSMIERLNIAGSNTYEYKDMGGKDDINLYVKRKGGSRKSILFHGSRYGVYVYVLGIMEGFFNNEPYKENPILQPNN